MPLLPEHILKLMSPEARLIYGKGGMTASEAQVKWQKGEERKMHDQFEKWCTLNSAPFVHSRFDQKATIRAGWPDFSVLRKGRIALIEFKAPGGVLRADQREVLAELERDGTPVAICESVEAAIQFCRAHLWP